MISNHTSYQEQPPTSESIAGSVRDPAGGIDATYEQLLNQNSRWALSEGSKFFEGSGAVQDALQRISRRLDELGIPYAVAGGMALFAQGYRRFTEDVDILVTKDGLRAIHKNLVGLGYIEPFSGSKNLRDIESAVRIKFLITGQFPGDGKPKPVAFPDPARVQFTKDGIHYLDLVNLVELKLASGMSSIERSKDLVDIQELIKAINLPIEFAEKLNSFVREKYMELWKVSRGMPKRFVLLWRNKSLTRETKSVQEPADTSRAAAEQLQAMLADGVTLEPSDGTADDYARLVTTDPEIAKKYDMHDEREFFGDLDKTAEDLAG